MALSQEIDPQILFCAEFYDLGLSIRRDEPGFMRTCA
jgi:hypothetical protein